MITKIDFQRMRTMIKEMHTKGYKKLEFVCGRREYGLIQQHYNNIFGEFRIENLPWKEKVLNEFDGIPIKMLYGFEGLMIREKK